MLLAVYDILLFSDVEWEVRCDSRKNCCVWLSAACTVHGWIIVYLYDFVPWVFADLDWVRVEVVYSWFCADYHTVYYLGVVRLVRIGKYWLALCEDYWQILVEVPSVFLIVLSSREGVRCTSHGSHSLLDSGNATFGGGHSWDFFVSMLGKKFIKWIVLIVFVEIGEEEEKCEENLGHCFQGRFIGSPQIGDSAQGN